MCSRSSGLARAQFASLTSEATRLGWTIRCRRRPPLAAGCVMSAAKACPLSTWRRCCLVYARRWDAAAATVGVDRRALLYVFSSLFLFLSLVFPSDSKRTWARQLPLVLQSTCQGASCMYVAADCRGWPCRRARTARRAASRPTRQTANHGSWQLCTIYASALLHGLVRRHRGRVGTTFGEPLRYRWSAIVRNLLGTSFPRVTWVGTLSIPTMALTWRRTRARARVRAGALQTFVFEADGIGSGTARHRDTWRLRERASVTVARPTSGRLSAVGITHERVPSVVLL